MGFKRKHSAYHRNRAGYTVIHDDSRSAYKTKRHGKHHQHLKKHGAKKHGGDEEEEAEVRFKAETHLEKVNKGHKHRCPTLAERLLAKKQARKAKHHPHHKH